MASLATVYRLIDDYTNTSISGVGTGGMTGQPLSPDFTATSLAIASQVAFAWSLLFNRPCRLAPVGGAPPFTLFAPGAQALPATVNAVLSGTASITNGAGTVVGTSSLYTKQLQVGAQVQFSNSLGTNYTVATITDDTHFTFLPVYAGATLASATAQSVPSALTTLAGTSVGVTNASASVTGVGVNFLSLAPGQNVQIGNQLGTNYTILSIQSALAMTLTATFTGATNAATTLLFASVGY
jgi:hypothetical protein